MGIQEKPPKPGPQSALLSGSTDELVELSSLFGIYPPGLFHLVVRQDSPHFGTLRGSGSLPSSSQLPGEGNSTKPTALGPYLYLRHILCPIGSMPWLKEWGGPWASRPHYKNSLLRLEGISSGWTRRLWSASGNHSNNLRSRSTAIHSFIHLQVSSR